MTDRRGPLLAATVFAVAVAARTLPLYRSPLPFNPDGLAHAANARATAATGSLPLSRLATDDLLFTAFLSTAAEATGVRPLLVAQPVVAVVGAATCLLAAALAGRCARRSSSRLAGPRLAAGTAGLVLAVEGLYLHRSMPVDEQTLGLLLVPVLAVAYRRWLDGGRRWGLVAAVVAVAVPPLHNLDGVVAALTLTALVAATASVRWRARGDIGAQAGNELQTGVGSRTGVGARTDVGPRTDPRARTSAPAPAWTARRLLRAVLPVAAFWVYVAGYHVAVAQWTPARLTQAARVTAVPGLVVAWAVLMVAAAAWVAGRPDRTRRLAAVAFLGPFALLAANALGPVVPGTPATSSVLVVALLPLAVPVAAAVVGTTVADDDRSGPLLAALVGGPFALLGVALTAGLTPDYLATAYRVQPFVHLPLAALAGLGVAALAARGGGNAGAGTTDSGVDRAADAGSGLGNPDSGPGNHHVRAGALVAVVLVASAASVPVAVGGLAVLPYKGVTTPGELAAAGFARTTVPGPVAVDDHLVRAGRYHGPGPESALVVGGDLRQTPVREWLAGGAPPPRCPVLAQRSWTTTGAQLWPAPPARLPPDAFDRWLTNRSVVYAGGGRDRIVLVVPRHGAGGRCR